jgi:uncharacterized membrane protein YgdD (TMEM256/DUF423 family)
VRSDFVAWAGVFGALGVAGGAFGAHALRDRISPEALSWFETGTRYHLLHALALFGAGLAAGSVRRRALRLAGVCFALGIVLFSGSLYALALGAPRWPGSGDAVRRHGMDRGLGGPRRRFSARGPARRQHRGVRPAQPRRGRHAKRDLPPSGTRRSRRATPPVRHPCPARTRCRTEPARAGG